MRILSSAEKCRRVARRMSLGLSDPPSAHHPLHRGLGRRFYIGGFGLHLRSFVTTTKPQPSLNHNLKSVPLVLTADSTGTSIARPIRYQIVPKLTRSRRSFLLDLADMQKGCDAFLFAETKSRKDHGRHEGASAGRLRMLFGRSVARRFPERIAERLTPFALDDEKAPRAQLPMIGRVHRADPHRLDLGRNLPAQAPGRAVIGDRQQGFQPDISPISRPRPATSDAVRGRPARPRGAPRCRVPATGCGFPSRPRRRGCPSTDSR